MCACSVDTKSFSFIPGGKLMTWGFLGSFQCADHFSLTALQLVTKHVSTSVGHVWGNDGDLAFRVWIRENRSVETWDWAQYRCTWWGATAFAKPAAGPGVLRVSSHLSWDCTVVRLSFWSILAAVEAGLRQECVELHFYFSCIQFISIGTLCSIAESLAGFVSGLRFYMWFTNTATLFSIQK